MGYIRHNAVIVTTWEDAEGVAAEGRRLGLQVIGPSDEVINGYRTMLVCPDGSKEGWADSDAGDDAREQFKTWLRTQRHSDGSSWLEWAEIVYGSDDGKATVLDDAWRESAPQPTKED